MNQPIDLRSDTVTRPTADMRRAMARAEVGDDVYGEDPTVNRLQDRAAEMFHRQAALFVPTGTMGNQIAVKLHTQPGQEVLTESRSHIFNYELAMMAAFSGCLARPIPAPTGHLSWDAVEPELSPPVYYRAPSGLLTLENTHNFAGGTVMTPEQTRTITSKARRNGLRVHLDGARIFHAATRLNTGVADLARGCDSIMFCLSKGLCAPVGSVLIGDADLIQEAWRVRKMMGGGMRQVGVLAAAGLIALNEMPRRLHEDHSNARRLAEGIAEIDGFAVDLESVQTNIVIVEVQHMTPPQLLEQLKSEGILGGQAGPRQIRFVTHRDVSRRNIESALKALQALAA